MLQYAPPAWKHPGLRQAAAAAPPAMAPEAPISVPASYFLEWNKEEVQTFAITQGVALAYALTAGFFYGKRADWIDRLILGVGSLGFGVASWASFRMGAAKPSNTAAKVTGGVMGTLDAVTALGALFAAFKPKRKPGAAIADAIVEALPI